MIHNYPYLQDFSFLHMFDKMRLKEQYVKINVLNFQTEDLIQSIESQVLSGSITLDGSSAMRRTANITALVRDNQYSYIDIKKLLTLNKKIEILVGFKNNTNSYQDYPMLWFPQGIFVIIDLTINQSTSGTSISLTLHDKMALLNGECGGLLPATTIFHEVEDISATGDSYIRNPTIYQIIQEIVNHFGNEDLNRIIISDLGQRIKQTMKWAGSIPLYLRQISTSSGFDNQYSTNYEDLTPTSGTIKEFSYGEDLGYIYTDFTYPGELIGNAGDSVVTILDQIKNLLGNYEYFYDIDGNFRFQEIKNNLNTSFAKSLISSIDQNDYLVDYSNGQSIYNFDDAGLIQSYSSTPQLQNIKNDFIVWGMRKTVDGADVPIRYHLAIDHKPSVGHTYTVCIYEDELTNTIKAVPVIECSSLSGRPSQGLIGIYYYIKNSNNMFIWDPKEKKYNLVNFPIKQIQSTDYRTELYLQGVVSETLGNIIYQSKTILQYDSRNTFPTPGMKDVLYYTKQYPNNLYYWNGSTYLSTAFTGEIQSYLKEIMKQSTKAENNPYYAELKNEWPKLYDIQEQHFFEEVEKDPSSIDFFLDIIDVSSELADFSVENIGRRTLIINDDTINCIFEPDIPDIILIESGTNETNSLREECINQNQQYAQVSSDVYSLLANGGVLKSAYEEIRRELYLYTNYNQQVSLTTMPIYYLEPNMRITINNPEIDISGEFMIKSVSVPLGTNEVMSISCSKILERI